MVLTAGKVIARIEGTLGGKLRSDLDVYEIMNDAGHYLVNYHPWKWLEKQEMTATIIQDQPFLKLPGNVREIIAFDATESLVNSLYLTSFAHLLRMRTYQVDEQSFHFYGAIEHANPRRPNMLLFSEDITGSAWSVIGATTPVLTANTTANPVDGLTNADTLEDNDAGTAEGITQSISGHLLSSGIFVYSLHIQAGTATETSIKLSMDGGTEQTTGLITWGATPSIALSSSAGTGSHNVAVEALHGGWVRASVSLTWVPAEGTGGLTIEIFPAGETVGNTGTVFVWGQQAEKSLASLSDGIGGSQTNVGPSEYVSVLGDQVPVGGPPELQLALWPIPNVTEADKLAFYFRGGWPEVSSDSDYMTIPDWFRGVFIETVMAFARGWEEEDQASLNQRLFEVQEGPLMSAAKDADGRVQPTLGELQGGAAETGRSIIDWGLHTIVSDP